MSALDTRAERYRLAWTNARDRAAALLAALVDADGERDALRAAYVEQGENVDIVREQRDACLKANYELVAERDAARAEADRLREALREIAAYAEERQHAVDEGTGLAQAALHAIGQTASRVVSIR